MEVSLFYARILQPEVVGKDGSAVRRYGSPQFLLRGGTVRLFCNGTVRLYCNGTGTVRWCAVRIKNTRLFAHCARFLYAEVKDS